VVINAAPAQGSETAEAMTALAAAGVTVSPIVVHQRKALAGYIQQGSSAGEAEPKGKAAEEIRQLFTWLANEVNLSEKEQVTKITSRRR
jgi:chromosome partitioning protein